MREDKREGNIGKYSWYTINALSFFAFIISFRMLVFHIFSCNLLFSFNSIFGISCFMPPLGPWYLVFPRTCLSLTDSYNFFLQIQPLSQTWHKVTTLVPSDLDLLPIYVTHPPRGGTGNPLQYLWLETPMDKGAWWTTVYRVAKSQAWLKWLSIHVTHPVDFPWLLQ